MPNADVIATSSDTGVHHAVRTNESGFYSLRPLPIGRYDLVAEAKGFHRRQEQGIALTTGEVLELNLKLEVGAVSETITVTASTSPLEARTSDASQLIEAKSIEDMPLGDRRAMNLLETVGGVVWAGYDAGSKPNFSLAGGRMQSSQFYIDGASAQIMRIGAGQMDIDPPVDTLQEVKVITNGFSAEFGGSSGGMVIATTKSGTNRWRGSLFEYLRNQAMDAPNFYSPVVDGLKQKPSLRYNVFGGSIGGPIKHDRTFLFAAYEGSRRRDGSIRTLNVPSLLERGGDFSQTFTSRGPVYTIYDPWTSTTVNGATVRTTFPGNRVPASRIDPVALKIIPLYPAPNRPADDRCRARE